MEQNEPFSSLKCKICRKYSFPELPQFSQGIKVLMVAGSIMHGFLSRDICVSPSQLNSPIASKQSISLP
jgi:hypothetical protein